MLYIITYNLNRPGQNYTHLIDTIRRYNCIHIGGSTWLVKSDLTAIQILNSLVPLVDQSDDLLVCEFSDWASYNLPMEFTNWMKL